MEEKNGTFEVGLWVPKSVNAPPPAPPVASPIAQTSRMNDSPPVNQSVDARNKSAVAQSTFARQDQRS